MSKTKLTEETDFKSVIPQVMAELNKRKLSSKFYKRFEYSAAIVSLWRNGKKIATAEQEISFVKVAIEMISEFDSKKKNSSKERTELFKQFNTLTA